MSELMTTDICKAGFRRNLLATVSTAVLIAVGVPASIAKASDTFFSDSDHPSFWVELGGNFERISGRTDKWLPPERTPLFGSGSDIRKDPSGSFGMEGKISYQPVDSPWMIWAAARYGRSQGQQKFHTQTHYNTAPFLQLIASNYNATSRHIENHMVVDFAVGRDIGLGLHSHAILGAGLRIAQFNLDSEDLASSHPAGGFTSNNNRYFSTAKIQHRTSAMGPAVTFSASMPISESGDSALMFDWGIGGAILFGRQKTTGSILYHYHYASGGLDRELDNTSDLNRAKSVVIPNVSVFAGASYHIPAAKIAIGYRADLYFNGIDGGLNSTTRVNRSFYGPFASISFGIGG